MRKSILLTEVTSALELASRRRALFVEQNPQHEPRVIDNDIRQLTNIAEWARMPKIDCDMLEPCHLLALERNGVTL